MATQTAAEGVTTAGTGGSNLDARLNSALGDFPARQESEGGIAEGVGEEHGDMRRKGGGPGRFRGRRYSPRPPNMKPYSQHRAPLSNRVYVGNLAYMTSWQDLKDHMRQAGNVIRADILEDESGRSKGCGIVEYSSPEEAQTSIKTLSDSKLPGTERPIFVREDREDRAFTRAAGFTRDRAGGAGVGGVEGPRKAPAAVSARGRQVFIGNLPYVTQWQELKDAFRRAGNIIRADVLLGTDGSSRGQGTVLFESVADAQRAIKMFNNSEFQGRIITVHEDRFA